MTMMIASGKKAIKPFPAGLCAAKRIVGAAPLNVIAASAPGDFPNYCRITHRKEIPPLLAPAGPNAFPSCARNFMEQEDRHSATDDPLPDAPEAQTRTARGSQMR